MTAESEQEVQTLRAIGRICADTLPRMMLSVRAGLTTGRGRVRQRNHGWSLRTAGNAIAAQFEHTIIVRGNEPIILTQTA